MAWNLAEALKLKFRPDSEYEEDDYLDDEEEYEEERPAKKKSGMGGFAKISAFTGGKKAAAEPAPEHEVFAIQPEKIDDASVITDKLLDGYTVVLNTERCDEALAMRIFDYACGTAYALNCAFGRVSYSATNSPSGIYIITPENTNISGAFQQNFMS